MSRIIIAITNVSALKDEAFFNLAYNKVSPYRKAKVDKIKMLDDKALSLGAELVLGACLNEFGEKITDFDHIENGKPVLKSSSIRFNISHSGDYVMCAVSSCDVGCDIQEIKDIDLKIAQRFFYNKEHETIISQPDYKSQIDMFFRFWTLKESFMKITGLGFKLPLNEFEVFFDCDRPFVNQFLNDKDYFFAELDAPQGYKASLCACDNEASLEFIELNILDLLK